MIKLICCCVATFVLTGTFGPVASAQTSGQGGATSAASTSVIPPSATGKVVGPDSKPQPGVPVQIAGPQGKTTVFTDQNGTWSVYNLEPGNYEAAPAAGLTSTNQQPVDFTVKQSGFFGSVFGTAPNQTYYATEMKIDKDWTQIGAHQN